MTLSLPCSARLSAFAMAAAASVALVGFASAPASVTAAAPYYTAKLAAPTDEDRAVAGGVAWACKADMCVAAKGSSRPMRICRGLSREFGEITSFSAKGKELDADKLAKCNGK
ncbi:MAG: hypothetical protein AAF127_07795 [Pseudomonadota bacterium]